MSSAAIEVDGRAVPLEHPAKIVIDLGLLLIVLLDPDAYIPKFGQFRNLVAIRRSGTEVWRSELPTTTTGDCFVAVEAVGPDQLRARSFSSFDVSIDALTGAVDAREFTK